jgi:hypothetical protein
MHCARIDGGADGVETGDRDEVCCGSGQHRLVRGGRLERAHLTAVGLDGDGGDAQVGGAVRQRIDLPRLQPQAAVARHRAAKQTVAVPGKLRLDGGEGQFGAAYFQKSGRPRRLKSGDARAGGDDGALAQGGNFGGQAEGCAALAAATHQCDDVGRHRVQRQPQALIQQHLISRFSKVQRVCDTLAVPPMAILRAGMITGSDDAIQRALHPIHRCA